jgi:hypothetical protein
MHVPPAPRHPLVPASHPIRRCGPSFSRQQARRTLAQHAAGTGRTCFRVRRSGEHFSVTLVTILVLEGPSAVGKTTLAGRLADVHALALIPELEPGAPPRDADAAAWFVGRHLARWRLAEEAAESRHVVVDGDPFKGLWYGWVYESMGHPGPLVAAAHYRAALLQGRVRFPDVCVVLGATADTLAHRRDMDLSRRRRNFELHLQLIGPQRRYFAAMNAVDPGRAVFLDASDPQRLFESAAALLGMSRTAAVDDITLFDAMLDWLRRAPPQSPAPPAR